mgnify:CR=1 FL=1
MNNKNVKPGPNGKYNLECDICTKKFQTDYNAFCILPCNHYYIGDPKSKKAQHKFDSELDEVEWRFTAMC